MKFESINEIIDFAIEKEEEAADFYKAAAEEESMSGIADMLREFSAEELKHKSMLEEFKKGSVDKMTSQYKLSWVEDIKRSDYHVDMDYKKGMGYSDVLMVAMKREEKALKLYNEMLDKVEGEEYKKVFKILCQEEAKHKLALETKYDDYMAKMGD